MSLLAQDERLTRRVGAVSLALIVAACIFFVFIYDKIDWGSHIRIRVYFLATGGLQEGAPFVVAGREIGKIESIGLSPRGSSKLLGDEDGVVVTVVLDADDAKRVMRDGDVFVTSRGALSRRYLEIGPPREMGAVLANGDELRGRDPPSLDRVLQRTWDNLTTTKVFAAELKPEADALRAEVDKLRTTLSELAPDVLIYADVMALADEAKRTYAALGGEPGVERLGRVRDEAGDTFDQARETVAKLRASADALSASLTVVKSRLDTKGAEAIDKIQSAIDRTRAAIDKIDPLLAQVDDIRQRIERGDGSLLKLMHDPEFPEDAKELGKILKREPWKILERPPK
jgi:phospholipid/cholesterol/gamma-HCH transport system substrate-binding protein